ncbi:O-acyltransferase WSD1-like [Chenopodium quinoa]|uniref:O-acyltransferase WSD1-like n=1 Tax=Chenopodium quinoa TaxID=63459 RepID=UPI000B76D3EC|nr:O-acyltransferase WSD1-like [Chenopodium quinoa]
MKIPFNTFDQRKLIDMAAFTFAWWLNPISTTRTAKEEPLSLATRLFHVPRLNCCIVAVAGFKTAINVDVVKEGLNQTLVKHPRFSSKLVFDPNDPGRPIGWIRTKVDVSNHIIVPNLDYSNMDSPDEFVKDYVSNLAQKPMDLTKPLWEIHILNIKTKDANSIAVFRTHHFIGDGISIMSLILSCTRKTSDPNALPTLPTENKKLINTRRSFSLWDCFLWLLFAFNMLWNTFIDVCMFLATIVFLKDTKTHLKGSSGTEKSPKKFVYRILSLDDIKFVKNIMNVTINDVVLGITQAGLSRYLNRKYSESKGDERVQKNSLPKHIRIRSSIPINISPTSNLQDLAEQMETNDPNTKKWEWGNAIGHIFLPFHIALREDPLDYILSAKATIGKKKHSLEAIVTYICAEYFLKFLGLGVAAAITYRVLSNTTLYLSNMVGPMEEISFYGHPMTFLAPSVYGHPQALTINFQSYMDKMTLVIAVDQNVIPEPQLLCDDIVESLELVKKAAQKKKIFKI